METKYPDAPTGDTYEQGLQFQDFVADTLFDFGIVITAYSSRKYQFERGENRQGFEIKQDKRCTDSQRLSVETGERTRLDKPWVDSGILRGDNKLYIQGNYSILFVFPPHILRQLHVVRKPSGIWRYERKEEPTLRSFYLPFADAERYATLVWKKDLP